ncbi:hypothetical protein DICPUDRAFT_16006, partial [Dictyostelium purpureum]
FKFNKNVQYSQIKINPITLSEILNNQLSPFQYIKLLIPNSNNNGIILQVYPDPTIEDNVILLPIEIKLKYNFDNNINNIYNFDIEIIPINQKINTNTTNNNKITIKIKKPNNYNRKIVQESLKRYFLYKPIIIGCDYIFPIVGNICIFKVLGCSNSNNNNITPLYLNNLREFEIIENHQDNSNNNSNNNKYKINPNDNDNELVDIREQIEQILEILELKFNSNKNNNNTSKIFATKGILIDGPEGTSKIPLVNFISKKFKSKYINLNDFTNEDSSPAASSTTSDHQQAEGDTLEPVIYIINNLDEIASKSDDDSNHQKRMIVKLSLFIDQLKPNQALIATCSSIENINQSITRAGRIDKFIHLSIPTQSKRILILNQLLKNTPIINDQQDDNNNNKIINDEKEREQFINELSKITPGFLYKDLNKLCRTAALLSITNEDNEHEKENSNVVAIKFNNFIESLKTIKPSSLINFDVTIQNVPWNKIGGYKEVKERFKELIEWPLKYSDTFKRLSLNNSSGLLLWGPSGCGKSLMVKAIATSMSINFISIKGSDIYSKWLGESERIIRELFKSARLSSPCIMFFDEIDSLALSRGDSNDSSEDGGTGKRILSQLLNEMDGIQVKSQIFLIGCTNTIDSIDSALLRPGRLETLIKVDLPTLEDRIDILNVIKSDMNFDETQLNDREWLDIASKTEGFTGSQLFELCNQAGIFQLEKDLNSQTISKESLEKSLGQFK